MDVSQLSPTDIAIEENMVSLFSNTALRSKHKDHGVISCEGLTRIYSGICHPLFNSVIIRESNPQQFLSQLPQMTDFFSKRHTPFICWWLPKDELPLQVESTLNDFGFYSPGLYSGVAMPLTMLHKKKPELEVHVRIEKITSQAQYQDFNSILCNTFKTPKRMHQDMYDMFYDLGPSAPWTHYIGYLHEAPVSILTVHANQGIAGIYNGCTILEARRQGICSAMIKHALYEAKKEDNYLAVAQVIAADMSRGILEKIGFKQHGHMIPFVKGININSIAPGIPAAIIVEEEILD